MLYEGEGNILKCFWKDILPEEDFLEKATTIKRFEYLPLDSQLENQTDLQKKPKWKILIGGTTNTMTLKKLLELLLPQNKKIERV